MKSSTMTSPPLATQDWEAYTHREHQVWATLYGRRMATLRTTASRVFLDGVDAIGLSPNRVPDLRDLNARLSDRTGWTAVPVSGFLPARVFFGLLAERRFPTTVTVRPPTQLDYIPEPDIFHDVFGHVPLLADPRYAECLRHLGAVAATGAGVWALERLTRLFWFTVEFGLIREEGGTKIFGSGLISSHTDAAHALGSDCQRLPFDLEAVARQPFEIDRLQDVLVVIDSFDELLEVLSRHSEPSG